MTSLQIQALVTVLAPFVIQAAKASQLKVLAWINQNSRTVNIIVSFLTALITSAGIMIHHTPGQIMINYPGVPQIIHGVLGFLLVAGGQFAVQHGIYHAMVRPLVPVAPPKP